MPVRRWAVGLALVLAAAGCGDETIEHSTDDAGAGDAGGSVIGSDAGPPRPVPMDSGAAGRHKLRIFIVGDDGARPIDDGASGQTPKRFVMGLGRFDIMKSADDPAPFTVFDHGDTPKRVDMLAGKTLGGEAAIAELPSGSYTHGRVLLTMAEVTLDATVHLGVAVPGELTIVGALSDTTLDGKPRKQNDATFRFEVGGVGQSMPGVLPPMPSTGGGAVVQQGGQTWMIFPFPEPMQLSAATARDHQATIRYQLYESFRWNDEAKPGYKPGVFDIDASAMSFEPVVNFGATDYLVTTD